MAGAILMTIAELVPAIVSLLDFSSKKKEAEIEDKRWERLMEQQLYRPPYYYPPPPPLPYPMVGGAARTEAEHQAWLYLLNRKIGNIDKPPDIEKAKHAIQLYDKSSPEAKSELASVIPGLAERLEIISKIYKDSPLPPSEKDRILYNYLLKTYYLDRNLIEPMAGEIDATGKTDDIDTPYVWVQHVLPDGRIIKEFKRREVIPFKPLPEAAEDIAEKMSKELAITGEKLYQYFPDLYKAEKERKQKELEEEKRKALEYEEKRIERMKEAYKKALQEYAKEARVSIPQESLELKDFPESGYETSVEEEEEPYKARSEETRTKTEKQLFESEIASQPPESITNVEKKKNQK